MHILVGWRQSERLYFSAFFCALRISNTQLASKQRRHGLCIADTVIPLNEADGCAAFFLGMVVPLITAYGHAVVAGKAFVPAG